MWCISCGETGYRCFKAVMFLVGFILATGIIFMICEQESSLDRTINAAIALGIGLLCGLLTMIIEVVGLFMTGVHMGLFMAVAVLIVMEQFYMPSELYIPLLITFGLCIVFALLTLKFQKECVVLATSLIGGAIVTSCSDYFLEILRMVQYIYDRFRLRQSAELCWYSWVVFGVWPFISLIGMLVQFTITSRGYNHKDGKNDLQTKSCILGFCRGFTSLTYLLTTLSFSLYHTFCGFRSCLSLQSHL
ncbi:putative transmembrane protein [Apostichopus japonicus]|uniref:Transmembrane protein 198 n=2 Tax=Stichopus japonicus TaxID=307972 RepID=A0A2G8K1M2_STIJA|nr:putative transmembrane protein [Apostichopus japonicus]